MAGAGAGAVLTGLRNNLSDEALRVKNFLEDYWQFNEIDPTSLKSATAAAPPPAAGDPFRVYYPAAADGTQRYERGYLPGFHSYDSCGRACEVPS